MYASSIARRRPARLCRQLLVAGLAWPISASASFLPPEMMDAAADIIALVVLFIVPIGAIAIFWLVHVLPEKAAEKRQHPQNSTSSRPPRRTCA